MRVKKLAKDRVRVELDPPATRIFFFFFFKEKITNYYYFLHFGWMEITSYYFYFYILDESKIYYMGTYIHYHDLMIFKLVLLD